MAESGTDLTSALRTVANMRIVFAHQSVGGNILDGVQQLAEQSRVPLEVMEGRSVSGTQHGIVHYKVGRNEAPDLKLSDFKQTTDGPGAEGVDVALLKLCYVDFQPQTDANALADEYIATLESLQARNPGTRYIAVTSPLTIVQRGPKAWIKQLLGRTPGGYELNAKRQAFNEKLRQHFPDERLFDLARFEAAPDGKARTVEFEGRPIEALDARLTYDGTHLNEQGQVIVARELVRFLANANGPSRQQ